MEFDREIDRRGTYTSKWQRYEGRDVLPFWVADTEFAVPDFISNAIAGRLAHPILGYTRTPDVTVAAFQGWLARCHGWEVPEEWLVWLPGVVPGLNMACRALAEPGGAVLVPTPVYYPFLSAPGNAEQECIRVPMVKDGRRWVMDLDALAHACRPGTRALLLSNPQNPTGRVFTREELLALGEFCEQRDIILCSDEIHCSLILDPESRHLPPATLAPELAKRTISLYAATKTYNIPGLNCAVAVIPDARLRARFRKARVGLVSDVGPLAYAASTAAFSDMSDWVARLLDYLRGNHRCLMNVVGERMTPVEGTYLAWIDLRDLQLESPGAYLEAHGLGLSDGAQFSGPGFVRFNFACPRALLERGLARYQAALESCARKTDR